MRVTLVGLLKAAAALTVFSSIVTLVDRLHHAIELFAHFRLQYFVVALLFALLFAVIRERRYAALLALTAIFNGTYVLPWYFGAPAATGEPLKILHANVHSSSIEYDRVTALIAEESPDIVFLQEVTAAWISGMQPLGSEYSFYYAQPREDNFGIAMYSRLPLTSVRHLDSPPLGYPTLVAELDFAGRPVTLISSHPTIPLGAHGYSARNAQLEHTARVANSAAGAIILIGDFNATPWSHSYRSFVAATGLGDAHRGFGVVPTWPTFLPFAMIPIDRALISSDVSVLELRTGARIGSDHLPLLLTVGL